MNKQNLFKRFDKFIGDMSYYNAAEGSWGKEASARNALKSEAFEYLTSMIKKDVVTLKELYDYHEKNKALTDFSDFFPYPKMVNVGMETDLRELRD